MGRVPDNTEPAAALGEYASPLEAQLRAGVIGNPVAQQAVRLRTHKLEQHHGNEAKDADARAMTGEYPYLWYGRGSKSKHQFYFNARHLHCWTPKSFEINFFFCGAKIQIPNLLLRCNFHIQHEIQRFVTRHHISVIILIFFGIMIYCEECLECVVWLKLCSSWCISVILAMLWVLPDATFFVGKFRGNLFMFVDSCLCGVIS